MGPGSPAALGIPEVMLPRVVPSASSFGAAGGSLLGAKIPVCGVLGDQQAALLGQACLEPGSVKVTYGTGCFCLLATGRTAVRSRNRLLTTVAWDLGDGLEYALEGSVFIGGAVVQWLRDGLHVLASSAESDTLARSVPDTGGVYFVPAFVGMGAPYWDPDARGALFGITRGTRQEHIVRAALESIAFQTRDLMEAMEADAGTAIRSVRVDGGASVNAFLMQFQSDIIGKPLVRPRSTETTALGAAFAAGLSDGHVEVARGDSGALARGQDLRACHDGHGEARADVGMGGRGAGDAIVRKESVRRVPPRGIEPLTHGFSVRCSTV